LRKYFNKKNAKILNKNLNIKTNILLLKKFAKI